MAKRIELRAGDTEPLEITVNAAGISNLDNVSSIAVYFRKRGGSTNHVDGAAATVSDSANRTVSFDPASAKNPSGDAFDTPGIYAGYLKITWSDGDITRHPARDQDGLEVQVNQNLE